MEEFKARKLLFICFCNDQLLQHHRIVLELGNSKNLNKNPVAVKAVQDLEIELLRLDPLGGAVSEVTLVVATANLRLLPTFAAVFRGLRKKNSYAFQFQ